MSTLMDLMSDALLTAYSSNSEEEHGATDPWRQLCVICDYLQNNEQSLTTDRGFWIWEIYFRE